MSYNTSALKLFTKFNGKLKAISLENATISIKTTSVAITVNWATKWNYSVHKYTAYLPLEIPIANQLNAQ